MIFAKPLVSELPTFSIIYRNGWQVYTELLEQFFIAYDIAADKKKAVLLISIDEGVYWWLRDLCHPDLPKAKTYEELIDLLHRLFHVRTSVFRKRTEFYNSRPYPGSSMAEWCATLKTLSADCKFGDQTDAVQLDRFISGLPPGAILDRLCEESVDGLTLQKAVNLAIHMESSLRMCEEERGKDDAEGGSSIANGVAAATGDGKKQRRRRGGRKQNK